ncbi:MAG: hypothetical protein ACK2T3_15520 [Candidatus Promineifilaceae bacterium]
MELQAVTGQLHILNGAIQQEPSVPGILAQTAPSGAARGRDNDFLFTHVTLSGPAKQEDPLLDDIVESISKEFYHTQGSVTAALRHAIIVTNNRLLDYNLSGAKTMREGAVTCAVQRGEELYVAQVGEAFALVGHIFGIERLPIESQQQPTPFGRTASVDIRFYHNWLQNGDMLLLADPRLSHATMEQFSTILVDGDVEEGLADLAALVGPDSSRAMMVEFTDEAPDYMPDAFPDPSDARSKRSLPPPTGQPYRESVLPAKVSYRAKAKEHLAQVDVEVVETSARRASSGAAKGLSRFTAWLAEFLVRLNPPRKETAEFNGWAMPMFLAVGIPLAVAAVVASVYFQRGNVAEISDLKTTMRENLYLARQSDDDLQAQIGYYNEVLQLAAEAEEAHPEDGEIQEIRKEALADLDAMEGVARLYAEPLYTYPEGSEISAIVLGDPLNGELFTLDSALGQVVFHDTGENYTDIEKNPAEVILSQGQAVGSHVAGDIVDILWRPRGSEVSRDGLAMLDKEGIVFTYYPNMSDTRAVPLGFAVDWENPSSMATYFERLYILDADAGEIWRYIPEGDGFLLEDEDRTLQFEEDIDIEHIIDFDIISEDASVLLLYDDGRIRRYVNQRLFWDEKSIYDSGLNTRLVAPVSAKIVGQGLSSSIYILDPGSDRLIQISLGGTFLAQYKVEDPSGEELLHSASDFTVASDPHRVFIVAGDTLYSASQE